MRTVVTREPEWTVDDVALALAQLEYDADLGSHGQPMSEATDGLADPNLRGEGWQYEPYFTRDYAADALRQAPQLVKKQFPDMTDEQIDRLVFGVRKVMKSPTPTEGG